MEICFTEAAEDMPIKRIYIAAITLGNFRGHCHVNAHVFRDRVEEKELKELLGKELVGKPDPAMPPELLAGATEEAALRCILEAFTKDEVLKLADYLKERYSEQIEKLVICPIDLPVPLGVGPLAAIPESKRAGFINFSRAKDYPLPFSVKAYFDLAEI